MNKSYLTAMHRTSRSTPAQKAYENIIAPRNFKTVLDWGCGHGADVAFFKEKKIKAVGYDQFYSPKEPSGKYDCVMCTYVLNVLKTKMARQECLAKARRHLKKDGRIVISARSLAEINKLATTNMWNKKNDGWITKAKTFQHGFDMMELVELAKKAGLQPISCVNISGGVMLVAGKTGV